MTSPQHVASSEEHIKRLLRDRIAQLESRDEDPPKSPDEQAAEDAFQVASIAARALVADTEIGAEEKLRVLQSMFTDCIADVRSLEYDLGLEEKRLSVAELDYSELGDDLRKIEVLTDKLKTLSRELSKQNKSMMEESQRRTAEERTKREEIVAKFDEAMQDINAKLNTEEYVDDEKDDLVISLEADLERLQAQYDEREKFYESSLNQTSAVERRACEDLTQAEEHFSKDELALVTERRTLMDLKKRSRVLLADLNNIHERRRAIEHGAKERQDSLKRQRVDMKRLQQSVVDLGKVMSKLHADADRLKAKSSESSEKVRSLEGELEFWKAKSKGELEKRETLERLCRTLTEERTIMRKEVQAMQAAWNMLESEIENLRMEVNESDDRDG